MARTLLVILMFVTLPTVLLTVWYVAVVLDGSIAPLLAEGGLRGFIEHLPSPSLKATGMVLTMIAFEALLIVVIPGKKVAGAVTPKGEQVYFKHNGLAATAVTYLAMGAWWAASKKMGFAGPSIIYDELGAIIASVSVLTVAGSIFFALKGIYFPSGPDHGKSGNPIFDFFWGTELYPRFGGVHIKQLLNCRYGIMGWGVISLGNAAKHYEVFGTLSTSMLVVMILHAVYVFRFHAQEETYYWSLDMIHDWYGWYLCWGVMSFLPVVYGSSALYLATHKVDLHPGLAVLCLALAVFAFYTNSDADLQRQRVRRTGGKTTVWGKPPAIIEAPYTAADGTKKTSILLASGWWGVSRHYNYLAEIMLAVSWSLPGGFKSLVPWVYPLFLVVLLGHRAIRDDRRCREKYGPAWEEYCKRVRFKILPGVF